MDSREVQATRVDALRQHLVKTEAAVEEVADRLTERLAGLLPFAAQKEIDQLVEDLLLAACCTVHLVFDTVAMERLKQAERGT